ncbi:MAG: hypothetical protein ABI551_14055, partial [Polyangiaceae bacterium]
WQASYDTIQAYKRQTGCKLANLVMLVVTDGGAPNAFERAYFTEHLPVSSAVITTVLTNPIKRGIATALAWTSPRFLFAEPKQWQQALVHIGMGAHGDEVWSGLRELQKRLPASTTLELISKACGLPSLAEAALRAPASSLSRR